MKDWIKLKEPVPMEINGKSIIVDAIKIGDFRQSSKDERAMECDIKVWSIPKVEDL